MLKCVNPKFAYQFKKGQQLKFVSTAAVVDYYSKHRPTDQSFLLMIRCNKCDNCVRYRSYQWSLRNQAESKNWKYSWFLTLTYNNDNIENADSKDIQLFFKRLRKNYLQSDLKYYWVMEKGELSGRVHFHALLYTNTDFLKHEKKKTGKYYVFGELELLWKMGYHYIAPATPEAIAYTCNYVTKSKHMLKRQMSKGLGKDWIIDNPDGYISGQQVAVPRFLKDQVPAREMPDGANQIFELAQRVEQKGMTIYDYMEDEKQLAKARRKKSKNMI